MWLSIDEHDFVQLWMSSIRCGISPFREPFRDDSPFSQFNPYDYVIIEMGS